jgi:GNAT superfamily N-acetyltransferase
MRDANAETHAPMEAPRIRAFRIQDFTANPALLAEYNDPYGYLARRTPAWIELLASNPHARPTDLALVLAIDGNTIVGCLGFYAAEVSLGGQRYKTFLQQEFFLDERYRPTGAGSLLLLPAISSLKCLTGAGNSAPSTVALCERLGFTTLGRLRRFVFLYRSAPLVRKYVRHQFAARSLASLGDPLLRLYNRYHVRRAGVRLGLTYRKVERFDDSLDQLLAEETRPFFPRGASMLNWIIQHRPLEAFTIHDGNRMLGYCLLNQIDQGAIAQHNLPRMRIGRLADYYLPAGAVEAKRDLLLFAIDHFAARQVDVLEGQFHDEGLPEICRRLGMFEIGGLVVVFRAPRDVPLADGKEWFLTFGTGDVILE